MSYESQLQTTLTYWAPSTADGFGGLAYSSPITLLGRYEDHNDNYIDSAGEEFISNAIVYTKQLLTHNGWVYKGVSVESNPQNVEGAQRIRVIYTTQNPSGTIIVYKTVLGRIAND